MIDAAKSSAAQWWIWRTNRPPRTSKLMSRVGREGLRHLDAAQRLVDAVVGDVGHGRVEEQRQVDAGEQQHDEAVQRDLTQQERPVGGEHLVELSADRRRRVVPRVDRVALCGRNLAELGGFGSFGLMIVFRSQNAGPTGSMKSPLATRYPSLINGDGQLRQRARSRAEYGFREMQRVELRLVARAEDAIGLLLVKRRGATQVRAHLGEREQVAEVEALLALPLDHPVHVARLDADEHHGVADAHQDLGEPVVRFDGGAVAVGLPPREHGLHAACVEVLGAHLDERRSSPVLPVARAR